MTPPSTHRRIACAGALAALLVPGAARADGPAPAPPPAVYTAPPLVYAPPPVPVVQLGPYTPMKRRSRGRIVAGILLLTLGGSAFLVGTTLVIAGTNSGQYIGYEGYSPGIDVAPVAAGSVALVLGSGMIAAGVPLLLSGLKRVPDVPASASIVPEVRAGGRGGALVWSF